MNLINIILYIVCFISICSLLFFIFRLKKTTKNLISVIKEKDELIKIINSTNIDLKKNNADLLETIEKLREDKKDSVKVVNIVPKTLKPDGFVLKINDFGDCTVQDSRIAFCNEFKEHLMEHFEDIVDYSVQYNPIQAIRTYHYRIRYILGGK